MESKAGLLNQSPGLIDLEQPRSYGLLCNFVNFIDAFSLFIQKLFF
jgi:hypothetical protein